MGRRTVPVPADTLAEDVGRDVAGLCVGLAVDGLEVVLQRRALGCCAYLGGVGDGVLHSFRTDMLSPVSPK